MLPCLYAIDGTTQSCGREVWGLMLAVQKAVQSLRLRLHSGLRQRGVALGAGVYCPG
jgi:hypothetical protein